MLVLASDCSFWSVWMISKGATVGYRTSVRGVRLGRVGRKIIWGRKMGVYLSRGTVGCRTVRLFCYLCITLMISNSLFDYIFATRVQTSIRPKSRVEFDIELTLPGYFVLYHYSYATIKSYLHNFRRRCYGMDHPQHSEMDFQALRISTRYRAHCQCSMRQILSVKSLDFSD